MAVKRFTLHPFDNRLSLLCEAHTDFFNSAAWAQLLARSLGAASFCFLDGETERPLALQVFQRGPARLGYLGFPLSHSAQTTPNTEALKAMLQQLPRGTRPHLVRQVLRCSSGTPELPLIYSEQPETELRDLPAYKPETVSKVRRDLKRADRAGVTIVDGKGVVNGAFAFALYHESVNRHGGQARYTPAYFDALCQLAERHPQLRVLAAMLGDTCIGFLVLALHLKTAYYLHGAVSDAGRIAGASDALVAEALLIAQNAGAEQFNFMASPPQQPSLVKFKEKWGARTHTQRTYTYFHAQVLGRAIHYSQSAMNRIKRVLNLYG